MYSIIGVQINKRNGKCIGQFQSADTFDSIDEAMERKSDFEIDTDTFCQKVVNIRDISIKMS